MYYFKAVHTHKLEKEGVAISDVENSLGLSKRSVTGDAHRILGKQMISFSVFPRGCHLSTNNGT